LTAAISLASCQLACAKVTTIGNGGTTNVYEENLVITSNTNYDKLEVNLTDDISMLCIYGQDKGENIISLNVKDLVFAGVEGVASNCLMVDSKGSLIVDGNAVLKTAYVNLNVEPDHTGAERNKIIFNGPVKLEGRGIGFYNFNEYVAGTIDSAVTTNILFNGEVSGEGGIETAYQGLTLNNPSNTFEGDLSASGSMVVLRSPGSVKNVSYIWLEDSLLNILESGEFNVPIEVIAASTINVQDDVEIISDITGEGIIIGSADGKTLSLEGENVVTFVDIMWGRIEVNGEKPTRAFEGTGIVEGATLGGNGTLVEYVMNYGTINPGTVDETGTLNIVGDCYQFDSSVISLRIDGEKNDFLNVFGSVVFDTEVQINPTINISITNPVIGKSYTVLSAKGIYGFENVILNVTESDDFTVEVVQNARKIVVNILPK